MRTSTIIGALLAGGLLLTGCTPSEQPSEQPPVPGTPPAAANAGGGEDAATTSTDQEFARQMLALHQQATDLAALAGQNAQSSQVKDLATRIQQGRQPEAAQIKTWLTTTGGQQPGSSPKDPTTVSDTQGLQSAEQVQALRQLRAADFDKAWVKALLDQHDGTLQVARNELEEGSDQQMRQLAEKIVATQQSEITELKSFTV